MPKVREFLERKAFGGPVELDTPEMVSAISGKVAVFLTEEKFTAALRDRVVQELEPRLVGVPRPLSQTKPFRWMRKTLAAKKCIFNLVPCDNEFEKEFARFLESTEDVMRFAKLPESFDFVIAYLDATGNLRFYEPDFVAVTDDGASHLIETKGLEDVNVAGKDRAARLWCENAARLTGQPWSYLKVPQAEYGRLQPARFADVAFLESGERGASAP